MQFIHETQTVWQLLAQTQKPIVLYGMGDGALKILRVCRQYDIAVSDIFASDGFVRGHSFEGYRVKTLAEIQTLYPDFIILVAFGVHDEPTMRRLYELSAQFELYVPDVPVAGEGLFTLDYAREHETELERVYGLLADEQSRVVFSSVLNYKISGKISYLKACTTDRDEAYSQLIKPRQDECYVDLGAYDGDTIRELLSYTGGQFEQITAFEPDVKNHKKLMNKLAESLSGQDLQRVLALNIGAHNEKTRLYFEGRAGRNSSLAQNAQAKRVIPVSVNSVDNILNGGKATLVKLDVEGAEHPALLGCADTIRRFAPRLIVSAYHRNEDLFDLPLLVHTLNPAYRLYLRHHPYIPAWDTNLYAVP